MFSDSDREFMAKNMKIVVTSIESKINEPLFIELKEIAIDAVSKYIRAIKEFEASGVRRNLTCWEENMAEASICAHFTKISEGIDDSNAI